MSGCLYKIIYILGCTRQTNKQTKGFYKIKTVRCAVVAEYMYMYMCLKYWTHISVTCHQPAFAFNDFSVLLSAFYLLQNQLGNAKYCHLRFVYKGTGDGYIILFPYLTEALNFTSNDNCIYLDKQPNYLKGLKSILSSHVSFIEFQCNLSTY